MTSKISMRPGLLRKNLSRWHSPRNGFHSVKSLHTSPTYCSYNTHDTLYSRRYASSKSFSSRTHGVSPVRPRCLARHLTSIIPTQWRRRSTVASEDPSKLPLAGIRVLDMTRVLAGVGAAQTMYLFHLLTYPSHIALRY